MGRGFVPWHHSVTTQSFLRRDSHGVRPELETEWLAEIGTFFEPIFLIGALGFYTPLTGLR